MFARSGVHKSGMLALIFLLLCIGAACAGPKAAPPAATAPSEAQGTPMSGERVVVVEQAPLRAAPSVDAERLAILIRGQDVKLVAVSPDKAWYLVRTDVYTGTGWILAELVDLPNARASAGTAAVTMYSGPGFDYERLGEMQKAWELEVIRQVNKCAWLEIITPTGKPVWVFGPDVILNVRCTSIPGASATPILGQRTSVATVTLAASSEHPSATPAITRVVTVASRTRVATVASKGLLPAPLLVSPEHNHAFDFLDAVLEWSPVKESLGNNEYYIVTIQFTHGGENWTDRAFSQETRWPVAQHAYLVDISDDGRFDWSVQLIHATGKDADGVPQGEALSSPSTSRTFVLNQSVPPERPTPDCGGYPCGMKEVPTPGRLLLTAGWLSLGFLIGIALIVEHPLPRKKGSRS